MDLDGYMPKVLRKLKLTKNVTTLTIVYNIITTIGENMSNASLNKPRFIGRPHNENLYYHLKSRGWNMTLHRGRESFIRNGKYDRSAKSNDGLFKGSDGKYYYCSFQEHLKDDGSFHFFQYSIQKKSRTSSNYKVLMAGTLTTDKYEPLPPGWPEDSNFAHDVTPKMVAKKINEIKALIKSVTV